MHRLIFSLLLLAPSLACGAELKLLGEAREHRFVTVESDSEGPWLVLGPNAAVVLESTTLAGTPVLGTPKINKADAFPINGTKGCKFVGPPGFYAVTQWPAGDDEASVLVVEILPSNWKPPPVEPDKPPVDPVPPRPSATSASYIYDKNQGGIPPPVAAAVDKINREKKIVADFFETPDAGIQIPIRYAAAVTAARTAGLPALVVMNGEVVVRVVKNPRTEQEVLDAVK